MKGAWSVWEAATLVLASVGRNLTISLDLGKSLPEVSSQTTFGTSVCSKFKRMEASCGLDNLGQEHKTDLLGSLGPAMGIFGCCIENLGGGMEYCGQSLVGSLATSNTHE